MLLSGTKVLVSVGDRLLNAEVNDPEGPNKDHLQVWRSKCANWDQRWDSAGAGMFAALFYLFEVFIMKF